MDPTSVFSTMWRQRWFVLPALLITLVAAGYTYQYGSRQYEATVSYALVNPHVPSEGELEERPELYELNNDNPYLRAYNPALITDVLIIRLNSQVTADALESRGLSTEYSAWRGALGSGFVIDITGAGDSPAAAQDTKDALGDMLVADLAVVQGVYGADPSYQFEALLIADSDRATERFSSRLRTVIGTMLAGGVLVLAAASFGEWLTAMRRRRQLADDRTARSVATHREPEKPPNPDLPVNGHNGTTTSIAAAQRSVPTPRRD